MKNLSNSVGQLYEWLTREERGELAQKFSRDRTWPAAILFYHRVAPTGKNPWSISVDGFLNHLNWLQNHVQLVRLEDLVASQRLGMRSALQCALTFDDGYQETVRHAVPLLIERNLPATFFICTQYLENDNSFPHDARQNQHFPPMNFRDLKYLVEHGFEIGGHTHSHLDLGKRWDCKTLRFEILDSRKRLQDWTGQEIRAFAFPYGMPWNMSQEAIDMVAEAGYSMFLSAYGAWNLLSHDTIHWKRIHGEEGMSRLTNWLTLDPRKFRNTIEFSYHWPASAKMQSDDQDTEKMVPIVVPMGVDAMAPHTAQESP